MSIDSIDLTKSESTEKLSQIDLTGIEILVEIDSIGIETIFLVGMTGFMVLIFLASVTNLMVLIFFMESTMGWAAPSHAQFFNTVVASTMASGSK